jgi:hypothetical protein
MQLMHQADMPTSGHGQLYCYSRGYAIASTAMVIIGSGLLSYLIGVTAPWVGSGIFVTILLCLLIFRKLITARFDSANWLVRLTDDGLYIKFRSYLNNHFPTDQAVVVFIPHSEIRSAHYLVEQRAVPDHDDRNRPSSSSKTMKCVELELASASKPLADALQREQRYALDGQAPFETTTRYQHLPVRLSGTNRLQIEWAVVPKAQIFLDALTRHTLVRPAETTTKSLVNLEGLSRAEQESRLLELAESGDKISAIAMARRLYGYDLAQASEFIDGLARKGASHS